MDLVDRPGWLRTLGASGIPTTAISLGLAALGRPGYLNLGHRQDFDDRSVAALAERTHEVLDAAHRAGVRHFDPARSNGRAEQFLGSWLRSRSIRPGAVTVSSKWGYTYTADWRVDADPPVVKELTADTFRRQLEETRELLGPYLSLYQIHSATLSSGVLEDAGVRRELEVLRSEHVAVGASVSGTEQGATIERVIETGGFDSVQATWNLLERSAGEALQAAHEAGLGVIVKEALANGRISPRGAVEPLASAAHRLGLAQDALAIAAVLAPALGRHGPQRRDHRRAARKQSERLFTRLGRRPRRGTQIADRGALRLLDNALRAALDLAPSPSAQSLPGICNVRYRAGFVGRAPRSA